MNRLFCPGDPVFLVTPLPITFPILGHTLFCNMSGKISSLYLLIRYLCRKRQFILASVSVNVNNLKLDLLDFYLAMHYLHCVVLLQSVVRPSACLSVRP